MPLLSVELPQDPNHSILPHSIERLFEVNEMVQEWHLICPVLLAQDSQIKDLLHSTAAFPESCLLFCDESLSLWTKSVENYFE